MGISLNDFDAIANGKYNLGFVRLSSDDSSLVKCNNHKILPNLRGEGDSRENLKVRQAFLTALSDANVNKALLRDIRERLGLNNTEEKSGVCMKPLMREEIRSIIDSASQSAEGYEAIDKFFEIDESSGHSRAYQRLKAKIGSETLARLNVSVEKQDELLKNALRKGYEAVKNSIQVGSTFDEDRVLMMAQMYFVRPDENVPEVAKTEEPRSAMEEGLSPRHMSAIELTTMG